MPKFESIHHRLALGVALGSLLFAVVAGLFAFGMEYRARLDQARQLQDQLVATVQSSAMIAAFAGNREIAQDVVDGLLANPVVAGVRLQSLNGLRFERQRDEASGEQVVYPLYSPVDHKDHIGDLVVTQDHREISARAIRAALQYAALLVVQIVISALLLMYVFDRVVGQPLTRVARMMEQVPAGSAQRIETPAGHENNEIGVLVRSTNTLLAAVEQAIIDERKLQAEVDEMQSHYRRIFETTNVGVMILRPSGGLINCNPTLMSRIVGVKFDAANPADCRDFIDTIFEFPARAWAMVIEARDSGQTVASDLRMRTGDGPERWAHCMISVSTNGQGEIELIEGVLYDVTRRRLRESEARRAAEMDALTHLANRRGMELFLDRALRYAEYLPVAVGVMLIDLDGFKAINDTHGHAAGDAVLQTVATRVAGRVRPYMDLAARLGGDEFVVVVHDSDRRPDLLADIARQLIRKIREPIRLEDGTEVQVGASIGIACSPGDGITREHLLGAADAAMYAVKRRGKNAYAFRSELDEEALHAATPTA